MSDINNNFSQRQCIRPPPPLQDFRWPIEDHEAQGTFYSYSSRVVRQVIFTSPFSHVYHGSGSIPESRVLTQGRALAGPLSGFPSFLRLPILDEIMARDNVSSPIHSVPAPPLEFSDQEGNSNRALDEHSKALKKMRKEIYNPAPKRLTKRVSQYYKDGCSKSSLNDYKDKQEDGEDKKRCTICLDDFEAKHIVMVTPCNHMFHEDCIVPWVKSHGQCPVCRFAF